MIFVPGLLTPANRLEKSNVGASVGAAPGLRLGAMARFPFPSTDVVCTTERFFGLPNRALQAFGSRRPVMVVPFSAFERFEERGFDFDGLR